MIALVVSAHLMFFGPVDFVSYNCHRARRGSVCRPVFWAGNDLCRDRTVVRKRGVLIDSERCVTWGVRW